MTIVKPPSFDRVRLVWEGRDGNATRELYVELAMCGPLGGLTVDLFRAVKNSTMAKGYRGGRATRAAYETKGWALGNIEKFLSKNAGAHSIRWGWKEDPKQARHNWVLYVDVPTGQVSFHNGYRGDGPDYPGEWDAAPAGTSADRIVLLAAMLLDGWPLSNRSAELAAIPRKPENAAARGQLHRRPYCKLPGGCKGDFSAKLPPCPIVCQHELIAADEQPELPL